MNDINFNRINLLSVKRRLKNVQRIIKKNDKILIRLRQIITDDIYYFGEYCVKHLGYNTFDEKYALTIIDDINTKQSTYDNICMENLKYLELESILKENIVYLCKKLGIENV